MTPGLEGDASVRAEVDARLHERRERPSVGILLLALITLVEDDLFIPGEMLL